jgi:hypothetical protein
MIFSEKGFCAYVCVHDCRISYILQGNQIQKNITINSLELYICVSFSRKLKKIYNLSKQCLIVLVKKRMRLALLNHLIAYVTASIYMRVHIIFS